MAALKRLIQGQDISFDTHQRGDGQPVMWRGVHMDKTLHGKRGKIRFPFFDNHNPQKDSDVNEDDYRRVVKEVSRVLKKDDKLLQDLARVIFDQLDRFSSGKATVQDARIAASKFAGYFGLSDAFVETVSRRAPSKRLISFVSTHLLIGGNSMHEISFQEKTISIRKID
jgi:hypothetical protein